MLSFYYQRYKLWFWLILFLAFEIGAISKSFYSPLWEVLLNAVIGSICVGIYIRLRFLKQKQK
ncbi:hypothetical protein J2Y67_004887 [Neobacillus niacini]|nr:hypothetical protein [Neobacillus niacini]